MFLESLISLGGSVFYQGDIILDAAMGKLLFPNATNSRCKRATVRERDRLWAKGVIPYAFAASLSMCVIYDCQIFYLFRCVLSSLLPMRSVGRSNFDKGLHNLIMLIQNTT